MTDKVAPLTQQLRQCARIGPGPLSPHWADRAKHLMLWAADTIDAADKAIDAGRAVVVPATPTGSGS